MTAIAVLIGQRIDFSASPASHSAAFAALAAVDALKATGYDAALVVDRTWWANLTGALATADLLVNATPIGNEVMRRELGPAADG